MGKRKRPTLEENDKTSATSHKKNSPSSFQATKSSNVTSIQIVTGSYDRVLHGLTARISKSVDGTEVQFSDNFLFQAHSSAIRCLAISPRPDPSDSSPSQRLILASGGTDERINLYHISCFVSSSESENGQSSPALAATPKLENPKNKELGSLLHHSSSINALYFPTKSKLLSGAEDNTIAVSRTRDWAVLSTIKAPIPKAVGRPSGDTAPLGGTPAGINEFAVHPSRKLMISVGKGEKCMRLWNLVTGKKAGVLNFEKSLLQSVGEGKHSSGEGQKVEWNSKGDEFAVVFDRGVAVFGMVSIF